MPPDQFKQLLDAVDTLALKKFNHEDVKMLFKICYWMGLRINEALKLEAESFDFSVNEVYLGKTKTEKQGYAHIPQPFKPELILYLQFKKGLLFSGMNRFIVHYWLTTIGQKLKISSLTTNEKNTGEKTKTHIFRKSAAKNMYYGIYGEKASLTDVSDMLRHKGKNRLASTEAYLRITSQDLDEYWKRIDEKKSQV